jgi:hypothetical protein
MPVRFVPGERRITDTPGIAGGACTGRPIDGRPRDLSRGLPIVGVRPLPDRSILCRRVYAGDPGLGDGSHGTMSHWITSFQLLTLVVCTRFARRCKTFRAAEKPGLCGELQDLLHLRRPMTGRGLPEFTGRASAPGSRKPLLCLPPRRGHRVGVQDWPRSAGQRRRRRIGRTTLTATTNCLPGQWLKLFVEAHRG